MRKAKHVLTRRDFIRTGSFLAAGGILGLPLLNRAAGQTAAKSRVVLVRDEKVTSGYGILNPVNLVEMMDRAMMALLDAPDALSAWQMLFKSGDIVGIKSNVWAPLATPAVLENMIQERLKEVGLSDKHVSVNDRGVGNDPVFKSATALINVRPMRTHHWSGLGTLLKNYIMFVPQPSAYHGNSCETLGAIWQKPIVKGKTRLNILVMLTPLFHSIGPHDFSKSYTWPYGGLIVSSDPVAADATGARIVQAKRNAYFGQERPISPRPLHIEAADSQYGLGNSRPERIELIRVGWDQDILI